MCVKSTHEKMLIRVSDEGKHTNQWNVTAMGAYQLVNAEVKAALELVNVFKVGTRRAQTLRLNVGGGYFLAHWQRSRRFKVVGQSQDCPYRNSNTSKNVLSNSGAKVAAKNLVH